MQFAEPLKEVKPLGRKAEASELVQREVAALKAYVAELSAIKKVKPLAAKPTAEQLAAFIEEGKVYSKANRVATLNHFKARDVIFGTNNTAKLISDFEALGLDY